MTAATATKTSRFARSMDLARCAVGIAAAAALTAGLGCAMAMDLQRGFAEVPVAAKAQRTGIVLVESGAGDLVVDAASGDVKVAQR